MIKYLRTDSVRELLDVIENCEYMMLCVLSRKDKPRIMLPKNLKYSIVGYFRSLGSNQIFSLTEDVVYKGVKFEFNSPTRSVYVYHEDWSFLDKRPIQTNIYNYEIILI